MALFTDHKAPASNGRQQIKNNKQKGEKKNKKCERQKKSSLAIVIENYSPTPSLLKKGRNKQKNTIAKTRETELHRAGPSPRPGQAGTVTLSNQTGGTPP
jgi:hypothetical protein